MTNREALLLLAFSWREKIAAMSWLELVLWIGLATLTLGLLVLVGTRWGQVRPVSKCVALSVFAHLLFLCYAYGTRLSFEHGSLSGDPFLRVSYISPSDGDQGDESAADSARLPADDSRATPEHAADELDPVAEPPAPEAAAPEPETIEPPQPKPEQKEKLPEPRAPELTRQSDSQTDVAVPPLLPDPTPAPEPPATNESPMESVATAPLPNDEAADPEAPAVPAVAQTTPSVTAAAEPGNAAGQATPTSDSFPPVTEVNPFGSTETASSPSTASSNDVATFTPAAAVRPVDGQPVPDPYRLRVSPERLKFALSFGANEDTETAVAAALDWLASSQHEDGRWDASDFGAGKETRTLGQDRGGAGANADTGISGLALLAFLGAGYTHIEGRHREVVQRGLEFLMSSQQADGSLVGDAKLYERMYCHGISLLALSEAYAMTGDSRLLTALRRGVQFTLSAQDRSSGGWRYQPGDRGDTSQFGWQVMALRSAELGGIETPANTRLLMSKFLDSVTKGKNRGLASYRPGERVSRTMTAEAMACRFLLELPASSAAVTEASDYLLQELPGEGEPNLYYWYYATLSLFQIQGTAWETWNAALQRDLLARQRRDGRLAGSWDTNDVWGGYGGRVYTTATATLCLEVYYRYLPIYDPANSVRQAGRPPEPLRR